MQYEPFVNRLAGVGRMHLRVTRSPDGHGADHLSLDVRQVCDQYTEVRGQTTDSKYDGRGSAQHPCG